MLAAVIAFVGAVVYGSGDFFGGLAAKRLPPVLVTSIAGAAGLALLLVAQPAVGGTWDGNDLFWGAMSGVAGATGLALLYACLAVGPMSILSPLTAVVSAIVPMAWAIAVTGERMSAIGYTGLAVALVAVVLVGVIPDAHAVRPRPRGLLMAIAAGIAFGAFVVLLDQTSDSSGLVPLIANRTTNALLTGLVAAVVLIAMARRGERLAAPRRTWALAILGGALDASANVMLLVALRLGDLSIVGALTALYPAGTIVLAAVILRERIARVQAAGLVLALAAGVLLALN